MLKKRNYFMTQPPGFIGYKGNIFSERNVSKGSRLCENAVANKKVSESSVNARTSVASIRILGVNLKTRRLYTQSANCVEGFYTAWVVFCRSA